MAVVLVLAGVGIDGYLIKQDGAPWLVSASSTTRPTSSTHASSDARRPAGRPIVFVTYSYSYSGVRPSSIFITSDGTNGISDIGWTSWGTTAYGANAEAIGHGQHGINDCTPDCATGTSRYWPDTIILSDPIPGSPTVWGKMTETYDGQTRTYVYCGAGFCPTWVTGAS